MNNPPSERRYRPILRMNDLLHPIQQRQRMVSFSTPEEPIGKYPTYSRIWAPTGCPGLFVVRVPYAVTRMDEATYHVLMLQRISWMIWLWMQDTHSDQAVAHDFLVTRLEILQHDARGPALEEDSIAQADGEETYHYPLLRWREEWAEALFKAGDRFTEMSCLHGLRFPIKPWHRTHADYQDLMTLHQDTDLESWIALLGG